MPCVAQITYGLGPASGYSLAPNCSGTIVVSRDGASYATIPITTDAGGVVTGVYTDSSPATSHAYTFSLQKTGCFAACNVPDAVVNWVSSGTAPPSPGPGPSGICSYTGSIVVVGTSLQITLGAGAPAGTYTVNFGSPVGIRTFIASGPGTYTVSSIPIGSYCVTVSSPTCTINMYADTFSPTPPVCVGCASPNACVVVASASPCAAQLGVVTQQGSSAYPVPTNKTFNSALQQINFNVTGAPGACFKINGVGTINGAPYNNIGSTSFSIQAGGVANFVTNFGQLDQYDVTWSIVPGDPLTAIDVPVGVTPCAAVIVAPSTINQIRGSTLMELVGSQGPTTASFSIQNPIVPLPETAAFTLTANGFPFAGSGSTCTGGTVVPLTIGADEPGAGTPGVFTILNSGPYGPGTQFCWKLVSTDGEHHVSPTNFQKTYTF